MEKNENGIRWFETQSSENCRFTNTVRDLSKWTDDFKTSGNYKSNTNTITHLLNVTKMFIPFYIVSIFQ